jgi:hypothetical protein
VHRRGPAPTTTRGRPPGHLPLCDRVPHREVRWTSHLQQTAEPTDRGDQRHGCRGHDEMDDDDRKRRGRHPRIVQQMSRARSRHRLQHDHTRHKEDLDATAPKQTLPDACSPEQSRRSQPHQHEAGRRRRRVVHVVHMAVASHARVVDRVDQPPRDGMREDDATQGVDNRAQSAGHRPRLAPQPLNPPGSTLAPVGLQATLRRQANSSLPEFGDPQHGPCSPKVRASVPTCRTPHSATGPPHGGLHALADYPISQAPSTGGPSHHGPTVRRCHARPTSRSPPSLPMSRRS